MTQSRAARVGMAALSARELEVLLALGEHLTNREIAHLLHISERTVESHVSSLLRKLDATDRRGLAIRAGRSEGGGGHRAFRGLPAPWTSFVGRKAEVDRVEAAALQHRLVTLLGPGGIGKTRLAAVVAERLTPRFRGGGAFVDLVAVEPGRIEPAIAVALGVGEQPGASLKAAVHHALDRSPALIVLDNCEHLLGEVAGWVETALGACPDLVALCTSRESLHVPGERIVVVPPMGNDARRLFIARAADNDVRIPDDPVDIEALCLRLDGNPLAIEIAAARLASLGLDGLRAGLDDALRFLGTPSSAPSATTGRHRSLRAVLEWSHDLLDADERTAFRRLGVFAGPVDLDGAEAVLSALGRGAVADLVGRLEDKSLLHRIGTDDDPAASSRWRMLDTVRAYAGERLADSGEGPWAEDLRLRWAASMAGRLEAALIAEKPWQERFDEIADDLRGAFAQSSAHDLQEFHFKLGMSLGHLAYAHFLLSEACVHYESATERAPTPRLAAAALRSAAAVARADQRIDRSISFLERAAEVAEAAGDRATQARALADIARTMGRFPSGMQRAPDRDFGVGLVRRARSLETDDPTVAASVALAAAWNSGPRPTQPSPELAAAALVLARRTDEPNLLSEALDALGSAASFAGRHQEAARLASERLALLDRMPRHDPEVGLEVFDAYHSATESALAAGDPRAAVSVAQRALSDPLYRAVPYHADSRMALARALLGDFDGALTSAEQARHGWVRGGCPTAGWMANAFFASALVHGLRGDWPAFHEWWTQASELSARSSTKEMPAFVALRLELHTGRAATELMGSDPLLVSGPLGDYARGVAAEVAAARGESDVANRPADHTLEQNPYAAAYQERASRRVDSDRHGIAKLVESWERLGARFEWAVTLTMLQGRRREGLRILGELGCVPPVSTTTDV
jgi:predicted ATPase/DNA-binding CsgD family transcriptional regulator